MSGAWQRAAEKMARTRELTELQALADACEGRYCVLCAGDGYPEDRRFVVEGATPGTREFQGTAVEVRAWLCARLCWPEIVRAEVEALRAALRAVAPARLAQVDLDLAARTLEAAARRRDEALAAAAAEARAGAVS